MIFDCMMFFNEIDLLKIRLEQHDSFVDKFIIIEADSTHSGIKKEYILEKHFKEFEKFKNKIIYEKISFKDINKFNIVSWNNSYNIAANREIWGNENFQRNYCLITLKNLNASDNDIIISSDLDEIIDHTTMNNSINLLNHFEIIKCRQKHYAYKLNLYCGNDTAGPKILKYSIFKQIDPSLLREKDVGIEINGGWHFSFLSDTEENVYKKYISFSHSFQNTDVTNGNKGVEKLRKDMIKEKVKIDSSYPKYIIDNLQYFKKYIEE